MKCSSIATTSTTSTSSCADMTACLPPPARRRRRRRRVSRGVAGARRRAAGARALRGRAGELDGAARAAIARAPDTAPAARQDAIVAAERAIARYDALVRRYPGSGYSDNALFQAADLARLLYGAYGRGRPPGAGREVRGLADARVPVEFPARRGANGTAFGRSGARPAPRAQRRGAAVPSPAAPAPARRRAWPRRRRRPRPPPPRRRRAPRRRCRRSSAWCSPTSSA